MCHAARACASDRSGCRRGCHSKGRACAASPARRVGGGGALGGGRDAARRRHGTCHPRAREERRLARRASVDVTASRLRCAARRRPVDGRGEKARVPCRARARFLCAPACRAGSRTRRARAPRRGRRGFGCAPWLSTRWSRLPLGTITRRCDFSSWPHAHTHTSAAPPAVISRGASRREARC